MYLYQIGEMRVPLISSSDSPLSLQRDRSFRNSQVSLPGVPGAYPYGSPFKALVNAGEYTLSGTLQSGFRNAETVHELRNYLLSIAGKPHTPIIAWIPRHELTTEFNESFPANEEADLSADLWVVTYGIVNSVSQTDTLENGKPLSEEIASISISITAGPYWEPLDYVRWVHRPHGIVPAAFQVPRDDYPPVRNQHPPKPYPDRVIMTDQLNNGFERVLFDQTIFSISPLLDPVVWDLAYYNDLTSFYAPNIGKVGTVSEIIGGHQAHLVMPPTHIWPAPPRSMYYFSQFNVPSAQLGIQVTTKQTQGVFTHTSYLDLDGLDTVLSDLGYDGIMDTDKMIIGDTDRVGGWYLRDNGDGLWEPIDVFIPWVYGTYKPGETFTGNNYVLVTGPSSARFAYLHIFRMY